MNSVNARLGILRKALGNFEKSKDGVNFAFRCPKCAKSGTSKKKLVIHVQTGAYHCWVCDLKGRNVSYLCKKYFPRYTDDCAQAFNEKINLGPDSPAEKEELRIPQGFELLCLATDTVDPDVLAVKKYCYKRNLTIDDMWYFRLGSCKKGKYRRRLIVPSFDLEGNLNYFVARAIDSSSSRKYMNPRVSKKDIVFNEINIDWKKELTIVEGPFDLMKCDTNATCLLGSSLSPDYKLFKEIVKNKTQVILALDDDAKSKTHKFAKMLHDFGISVKIMDVSGVDDVGSMKKEEFLNRKKMAKSWKSCDHLYHLIGSIKSGSII